MPAVHGRTTPTRANPPSPHVQGPGERVGVAASEQRHQGTGDEGDGERAEEGGREDEPDHGRLVTGSLAGPHRGSGGDGHGHDQDHRGDQAAAPVGVGRPPQQERHDGDGEERNREVQNEPGQQGDRTAQQGPQRT